LKTGIVFIRIIIIIIDNLYNYYYRQNAGELQFLTDKNMLKQEKLENKIKVKANKTDMKMTVG